MFEHTIRTACVTVAFPRGPTELALRRDLERLLLLSNGVVSAMSDRPVEPLVEGPATFCSTSSSLSSSSSSSRSSPAYDKPCN